MSFRYMRVIVFFDLPTTTIEERRDYRAFRRYLISNGFLMMQESVYSKLVLNAVASKSIMAGIRKHSPLHGLVQMMLITEKQYSGIELVVGECTSEVVNSTDRVVVL